MKNFILKWTDRKIVFPIQRAIKEGLSIRKLAVSLALGITVGLIPLYGFTTFLVGCIAISLRLNFVAMQVAHYVVHPIQIALLIPFLKLGDIFVKKSDVQFSVHQYIEYFRTDFWGALHDLWLVNLSAIVIWSLLALPLFFLLYRLLVLAIKRFYPRMAH